MYKLRTNVLMEVTKQTVVCCYAMLCSLVKEYKCFRETYCYHHQGGKLEAARNSGTLIHFYQTMCHVTLIHSKTI